MALDFITGIVLIGSVASCLEMARKIEQLQNHVIGRPEQMPFSNIHQFKLAASGSYHSDISEWK